MKNLSEMNIAVLMGGPGSEREVSLASGEGVCEALRGEGANVHPLDVRGPDFTLPAGIDIAFNVVHGTFGEDGQIQACLEKLGVPYTGEGVDGSRLAFDKILSKQRFVERGVATPQFEILKPGQDPALALPIVVKAPREGSSVGVHIVKTEAELAPALEDTRKYASEILVEKFIPSRELTVGILGDQALPIIEIVPKSGFYDFRNKYPFLNPGGGATHYCPAHLPPEVTDAVQKLALDAHRALDLMVYSRVDVLLSETGESTVIEVNTIPGMTKASLLPEAAQAAGLSFGKLCQRIIELSFAKTG
jgi:D-alanine-D-alanine ligase